MTMGDWKAKIAAETLLKEYAITEPNEVELETVVKTEGVLLETKPIKGADGRIVFHGKRAVIVVSSQITHPGRRRFVIAHELGHFKMHKELKTNFQCTEADFLDFHTNGSHETEANVFASEFLMPKFIFKNEMPKGKAPHECVFSLSDKFQTSWTATAMRFVQHGNFPSCLLFSKAGFVKWYKRSDDFIGRYPRQGEPVPTNSIAAEYFKKGVPKDNPSIIQPVWFKDDLPRDCYFYEYCLPIPTQNAALSLVWRCEQF